jgi:hypothetical protein
VHCLAQPDSSALQRRVEPGTRRSDPVIAQDLVFSSHSRW